MSRTRSLFLSNICRKVNDDSKRKIYESEPGRIENYTPGNSSISQKQTNDVRFFMNIFKKKLLLKSNYFSGGMKYLIFSIV